jgi:hypothetical protein
MEDARSNMNDGGTCPSWYEIKSSGYPQNGWNPSVIGESC